MSTTTAGVASVEATIAKIEEQFGKKKPQAESTQSHASPKPKPVEVKKEKPAAPKPKHKPAPVAASKPTKFLPSERIAFSKQLDILRAWAAASGSSSKIVSNNDVAVIVKMQPSTVSMGNAFFSSIGLLLKADGGYIPAPEVVSFLRAYEWAPDTAATKLAPVIAKSWFAEELLPKLSFAPLTTDEAIQRLADACSAGPDYRDNLEILLEYLNASGLAQCEGGQVRKGVGVVTANPSATSETQSTTRTDAPVSEPSKKPTAASTSFFGTTEGAVNFNVSVRVDMSEFKSWKPEVVAAFFNGMAQVLSAKAQLDRVEQKEG